jgi:primosomal protein N' (replication factor Y) (superfamily II helicase)
MSIVRNLTAAIHVGQRDPSNSRSIVAAVPKVAQVEPITTARVLRGPFDYICPEGAGVGSVMVVPFAGRDLLAVVTAVTDSSEHEMSEAIELLPVSLPRDLVALGPWLADEYCSTPARAYSLMLPPRGVKERSALYASVLREPGEDERLTANQSELLGSLPRLAGGDVAALRRLEMRGLVLLEAKSQRRAPKHAEVGKASGESGPPLTSDQADALGELLAAAPGEQLLLHGVTGSGKTEVYLRAAAEVLAAGKTVLVLVPEIALTPQIISRFVERFGETVAVIHSKLSPGERFDEWMRLRSGEARICIGARSAVFAPMSEIGLIIVDEEHDSSYKNEGDPRYDARHVAARRAEDHGAVLVAGSATPRAESWQRLRRLSLPSRVDQMPLPEVEIIDLRGASGVLHPDTFQALVDSRKSIVLLNRRGWSNYLSCSSCGYAWECPQCDVTLVLHRASGSISCHHCGHRERVPERCVECGSVSIARHGTGTERLETELPGIVFRLDGDAADAGAVLRAFEQADEGILLGTQVVAKGHDFPDVELGVVVDADQTLRFPDFRAEERTFSLVTQLAGRSGRGSERGRVIVQSFSPDAPALTLAAQHDAPTFLEQELSRREALRYPPFSTLIRIVCSSPQPGAAQDAASQLQQALPGSLGPAPLFRLRGRERSQIVIKAEDRHTAVAAVNAAVGKVAKGAGRKSVAISVDVEPQ